MEPGFDYPGGKNDPNWTPQQAAWHFGICHLWTAGGTVHTEEGKWGRVPAEGMLQARVVDFVRDNVWLKIPTNWQMGAYNGSHLSNSPVDFIENVWTYSSLHPDRARSIRVQESEPQPRPGWQKVESWGPGNSFVTLVGSASRQSSRRDLRPGRRSPTIRDARSG